MYGKLDMINMEKFNGNLKFWKLLFLPRYLWTLAQYLWNNRTNHVLLTKCL
jgi:hypothetical protein